MIQLRRSTNRRRPGPADEFERRILPPDPRRTACEWTGAHFLSGDGSCWYGCEDVTA